MAIDPICGMTVDQATARSAERDGQTFYFCGESCRRKFLAGAASAPAMHHRHGDARHGPASQEQPRGSGEYVCPTCEGVESDRPGDCPECGMDLEPARPVS